MDPVTTKHPGMGLSRSEPGVRLGGGGLSSRTVRINCRLTVLSAPTHLINTPGVRVEGVKTESGRAKIKRVLMDRWWSDGAKALQLLTHWAALCCCCAAPTHKLAFKQHTVNVREL